MAMELWIFSDKRLSSIAEWQAAINLERYPLALSEERPIEQLNGFLPCRLREETTGFECYHDDASELARDNAMDLGRAWKYVLGLRWLGSNETETLAAWMAGTAYARATDGVIFNDQDSQSRTASEGREVVHSIEHPSEAYEEAKRELMRRRELRRRGLEP